MAAPATCPDAPEDEVAIEATCNTHAVVRLIAPHVARVVVSNPQKTRAIAEAKVKTDKVDCAILAELLAADFLLSVWVADEATHALRRQVARRANIVRRRTRLKNQVQAILQRNLIPRCPAADMFGVKGRSCARARDAGRGSVHRRSHPGPAAGRSLSASARVAGFRSRSSRPPASWCACAGR